MKSTRVAVWCLVVSCLIALCGMTYPALADELATITGRITDPQGLVVAGVKVEATNINTNITYSGASNADGLYRILSIPPGAYRVIVQKTGFAQILKPGVELHVQDIITLNFTMQLGSVSQTITVEGGAPLVNTESAAVSTVVDRQFAENLPMNGRSFQTLIQLTPGVVLTPTNGADSGQFSVNGQRAIANYWMVDGVSANIGISTNAFPGSGAGGTLQSFSVQGGTNSLVSVDALQEFRIQTSTYAPEFGRTPGAQISLVTRSGTNQFHGTAFDYLRNDVLDANDWFVNSAGLPKPEERQNDFGGTLAGPILKNKTFFFFSYEGLRLRLPQVQQTTVPSLNARQKAIPAMQPFLNAFPAPKSGAPDNNGVSPFNASYSDKSTLNATSIRIDHKLNDKFSLFGRYNYSPSELAQRPLGYSLSTIQTSRIVTQTATAGTTWTVSAAVTDDFRFNYSRNAASGIFSLDNIGGAVPLSASSLSFPPGFTSLNSLLSFISFDLSGQLNLGSNSSNLQRQINLVDTLSMQKGSHNVKFGVDYRRLMPVYSPPSYSQTPLFFGVPDAETGAPFLTVLTASRNAGLYFQNLGIFAQDTWRIISRLTLTYGLRWDVDSAPTASDGISLLAVTNFDDLAKLSVAPQGTPLFSTKYSNFAPRVGSAYQLRQQQGWETVVRGGVGMFFDLATQEVGNSLSGTNYPFGAFSFVFGAPFPLNPSAGAPPAITRASLNSQLINAFDPNLKLPYTLEWSAALEQGLGAKQTLSASYIGSRGRRLIQTEYVAAPNSNIAAAQLVGNDGTSDYNALQVQFQRRLSRGLQSLASYTWAHSIDTGSTSSFGSSSNLFSRQVGAQENRGPSDFDIRHAVSAGLTYDVAVRKTNIFTDAILRGWSLHSVFQSRSAPPVDVSYNSFAILLFGSHAAVRPDLVPGVPLYVYGAQYPGGRIINNTTDPSRPGCVGPFCPPPTDPTTHQPTRQGNLGRNALRGFGAWQWDFGVHRDFPIHEAFKLQFRAELFNVLNHPNFGNPIGNLSNSSQFGHSIQMLGRSLAQNPGGGSFSPLYQIGGPRSVQLALKLQF